MSKDKKTKVTISEEALNDESKVQEVEVRETKDQKQKIQELNFQGLKNQEIKLHETKKPVNLPANAMPVDGYVLSIDGKLKKRYESAKEAMAAGAKLKQSYPVIQVAVYDATERSYTPVELQEQEN